MKPTKKPLPRSAHHRRIVEAAVRYADAWQGVMMPVSTGGARLVRAVRAARRAGAVK